MSRPADTDSTDTNAADTTSSPSKDAGITQAGFESLKQAAHWYAVLRADDVTQDDHAAWHIWLDQHPEHRIAWQHVEAVSRRFQPLQTEEEQHAAVAALKAARKPNLSRRKVLNGAAAIAGISLFSWATWRHTPLSDLVMAWAADHHTGVGDIREIVLADGSRLWLNTDSTVNVDYHPALRRLQLITGEILIQTASDSQLSKRPFVIDTEHGRLQALGTRFTVRLNQGETYLAVFEGAVKIRTESTRTSEVITAGWQTRFTQDGITESQPAERARQAWAQGILLADNMRLQDLVAELSRYRSGHLGVAPEIANLRVMGTYPINDPDRTLAMLEEILPVRVRHILPWWVTIEAR